MLERWSNMPFSVGGEENHLFFIEEVEVFANKFFAVVYGCRWIRRLTIDSEVRELKKFRKLVGDYAPVVAVTSLIPLTHF